jgi:ferritin
MLSKTMQKGLNDQIQKEFYSSYLYLAMSACCEANNLPGSAKWTQAQSREEYGHAMKLYAYVNDRGGRTILEALPKPPAEYRSMLDIFKKVLEHEKHVTASIHKLYAQAVKENDYASQVALQWFVSEQVEEEKNATAIVEQIQAVGDSKGSLMYIDRALGKRGQ